MVTYRHAEFIAQAIESVLMQEADFPVELVIGEDKSPDDTRQIVARYVRRHPEKVRLLARPENLGVRNFVETYRACRGKYVAMLEGDDYWTSPEKLRVQVEALDTHPDWVICFHAVRHFRQDGSAPAIVSPQGWKEVSTLDDLLEKNVLPACSVMFRNGVLRDFPEWFLSLIPGDWPLWVMLARHGNVGYIDREMAAHRLHRGGLWTGRDDLYRMERSVEVLEHLRRLVDVDRAVRMTVPILKSHLRLAGLRAELGDRSRARAAFWGVLRRERVLRRDFPFRAAIRTVLQIEAPAALRMLSRIRRLASSRRAPGQPLGRSGA